jgi:hypothetical protein
LANVRFRVLTFALSLQLLSGQTVVLLDDTANGRGCGEPVDVGVFALFSEAFKLVAPLGDQRVLIHRFAFPRSVQLEIIVKLQKTSTFAS